MKTSIFSAGVRDRFLIQRLALYSKRSGSAVSEGFTLIELLVVVIIVGILAAVALPSFLNQSDKAKAAVAKSLTSSGAKECQAWLVDRSGTFAPTTSSGDPSITYSGAECPGDFTATINGGDTYKASVDESGKLTPPAVVAPAAD